LRMMFERGPAIRIGQVWWYGGGEEFMKDIGIDDPDMVFGDGDVRHFDTSINRVLMQIYMASSGIYYDLDKADPESEVYKRLLRVATRYLVVRVTHFFKEEWRIVIGGMPSGSLNTSHGDSWILGFLICLFIEYTYQTKPPRRRRINVCFYGGKIKIVVYGDDHVLGVSRSIWDIINEKEFAKFLWKFWDMELRDIRNSVPGLSVCDQRTGTIKEAGVVFLQRYFIPRPAYFNNHDNVAAIVPFRSYWKYAWKIPFSSDGSKRDTITTLIACIGTAYDSMGTNLLVHEYANFVFGAIKEIEKLDDITVKKKMRTRMTEESRDITKIQRKTNISYEQIANGFPSLYELEAMHVRDPSKTKRQQHDIDHIVF